MITKLILTIAVLLRTATPESRAEPPGVVIDRSPDFPTVYVGWEKANAVFNYSDKGKAKMAVFTRLLKSGQELVLPQGNWSGTLMFFPPEARL
jgi:hypothetical protein